MSERNLRKHKPMNYNKLHQGMDQSELEDSDQELELGTTAEAERDLCGSFEEGEEFDYEDDLDESEAEEGEISHESEPESEDEDPAVTKCIRDHNIDKLKKILKKREEACKKLQKDLKKERLREKQDQEMRGILQRPPCRDTTVYF